MSVPTKISSQRGRPTPRAADLVRLALAGRRDPEVQPLRCEHLPAEVQDREEGGRTETPPPADRLRGMSRCCSDEPRRLVAASIGCALPSDRSVYGYLSEHHAFGQNEKVRGLRGGPGGGDARVDLGVEFDEDKSWDEKRESGRSAGRSTAPSTSRNRRSSRTNTHGPGRGVLV